MNCRALWNRRGLDFLKLELLDIFELDVLIVRILDFKNSKTRSIKIQSVYFPISRYLSGLLIAIIVTCLFANQALAAPGINRTINFQGKVVNKTAGTNVTNGNYDFTFRLYDAASNGTLLWTENWTGGNQITVTDGIFRATLGSITTFASAGVDFNSDSLYLDITFNGETMGSRVRFTAVPYALNAEKVSGLTVTNNGGNTLNIAANKTFTVNNSVTFSGTDGTIFTLPTATDTLVGLVESQTLTNKTIGSTGLVFSGASTDIDTAAAEGLVLQGRAASSLQTTSGNITLQSAGTGTTGTVQIGGGGAGSTTPDILGLDVKSDTGDPTGFEGAMYYNTSDNKFRCYQNSGWTDCITSPTGVGADSLDFTDLEDTLDLDTALTLNQTTNTWTQNFTGTTSTGLTYNANNLTTGKALYISSSGSSFTGGGKLVDLNLSTTNTTAGEKIGLNMVVSNTGGVLSGGDSTYGQKIDLTSTGAAGGANTFAYGQYLNIAADVNVDQATGNYFVGTGANSFNGIYSNISTGANSSNYNNYSANNSAINHEGSGTLVSAVGNLIVVGNNGGGTITTAYGSKVSINNENNGTLATAYGYYVDTPGNEGTFTNNYGVYINDQSGAGSTNSYNLYSAGATAKNYLQGALGIGTDTTPEGLVDIEGARTGQALLQLNETGNQDLITASASGVTKFKIAKGIADEYDTYVDTYIRTVRNGVNAINLYDNGIRLESYLDAVYAIDNDNDNTTESYKVVTNGNQSILYTVSQSGDSGVNARPLVGFGTANPAHALHLNTWTTGKALAALNETTGNNDIFTASSSGVTRFVIENDGDIHVDGVFNVGDTSPDATAYNKIGTGTKGGANVADGSDLYVTDSLELDGTFYIGADGLTDITGSGLTISSGALTIQTPAATDNLSSTTSNGSGLEVLSGGLALLQGCSDGQILKWAESSDTWGCASLGADAQSASAYDTNEALTNILNSEVELLQVDITPTTATGDVYVRAQFDVISSNNTDQSLVVSIENNGTCTGTAVATQTLTITSTAGTSLGTFELAGIAVDAGASAQSYTLCASTATGDTDIRFSELHATVIDNGADYAEVYTTNDDTIEAGDVVAIDASLKAGVKKTHAAYESTVTGVVSTFPGLIVGGVQKEGVKAVPVALSGRVPVKVSTENGQIMPGDPLAPSSMHGVAMKATGAGYIIGRAMEGFDGGPGAIGKVMTFVHVSWYYPETTASAIDAVAALQEQVASLSAVLSAMVPLVGSASALPDFDPLWLDLPRYKPTMSATESGLLAIDLSVDNDATIAGKLRVKGSSLFEDIVSMIDTLITDNVIVNGTANFFKKVLFKDDVEIQGKLIVSADTSGIAVIKKDSDQVIVKFVKGYDTVPLITTSIALENMIKEDASEEERQKQSESQERLENAILNGDIHYIVTRKTQTGFIIKLNRKAPEDIQFAWTALAGSQMAKVTAEPKPSPTDVLGASVATITEAPTGVPIEVAEPEVSIQPTPIPLPTADLSKFQQTVTVLESELGYLRVRKGPRSTFEEIGQIEPGQTFGVLESENGWFKIEFEHKIGWVSSLYVAVKQ